MILFTLFIKSLWISSFYIAEVQIYWDWAWRGMKQKGIYKGIKVNSKEEFYLLNFFFSMMVWNNSVVYVRANFKSCQSAATGFKSKLSIDNKLQELFGKHLKKVVITYCS